jgi:hypothetical protein
MSAVDVVCFEGARFRLTKDELVFSKLLSRLAGDILLVPKVDLATISGDVMAAIHRFMQLAVDPPTDDWLDDYLAGVVPLWCPILQAAQFLEIDVLADGVAGAIAERIQQCNSLQSVCFGFNRR